MVARCERSSWLPRSGYGPGRRTHFKAKRQKSFPAGTPQEVRCVAPFERLHCRAPLRSPRLADRRHPGALGATPFEEPLTEFQKTILQLSVLEKPTSRAARLNLLHYTIIGNYARRLTISKSGRATFIRENLARPCQSKGLTGPTTDRHRARLPWRFVEGSTLARLGTGLGGLPCRTN